MTRAMRRWALLAVLSGSVSCMTGSSAQESGAAAMWTEAWVGSYAETPILPAAQSPLPIRQLRLLSCAIEIDLFDGGWVNGVYELGNAMRSSTVVQDDTMFANVRFHVRERGTVSAPGAPPVIDRTPSTISGLMYFAPPPGANPSAVTAGAARELDLTLPLPGLAGPYHRFVFEPAVPKEPFLQPTGCEDPSLAHAGSISDYDVYASNFGEESYPGCEECPAF